MGADTDEPPGTKKLRTGQVSAAAGVNLETLRYYERRKLLEEPERTAGGHRLYPQEAVTVVRVIKAAQRLGFSLDEIADLLDTGTRHEDRRQQSGSQAQVTTQLAEVEAKIADLAVIRDSLRASLDVESESTDDTPPAPPFSGLAGPSTL